MKMVVENLTPRPSPKIFGEGLGVRIFSAVPSLLAKICEIRVNLGLRPCYEEKTERIPRFAKFVERICSAWMKKSSPILSSKPYFRYTQSAW